MILRNLRYLTLLVVIVAMMILSPFVSRAPLIRILSNITLTLVLLSVVNTVKEQKRTLVTGLCLGVPWILAAWMYLFSPAYIHPAILAATSVIFEGYIIFVLLSHIIREDKVTADILYGAFSVYILLGVFFTSLYLFFGAVTQTPLFAGTEIAAGNSSDSPENIFYFSFVTLTTLGYGDIRPIADISRIFAILEAMIGVLYSAALIGRLVGLYVAQYSGGDDRAGRTPDTDI